MWLQLLFKVFFYLEIHQNNIFFLKKNYFLSAHQNDLKTQKIYQVEAMKKIKKKFNLFKSAFETQKQIGFYEI